MLSTPSRGAIQLSHWPSGEMRPAVRLGLPKIFNLYANPTEDENKISTDSWVAGPMLKMIGAFEESTKAHPLIPIGTADPYTPPK